MRLPPLRSHQLPEQGLDPLEDVVDRIRVRERRYSEVIRVGGVEAAPGRDQDVMVFRGSPDIGGRFFYNKDLSGLNFERSSTRLGRLLTSGSTDVT